MYLICADMEGIFTPEIWINVAEKTGIEELRLTTRDISDYDVLMKDLLHIKDYNAAKRSVFVIMEDGKIGYKWVSDDPLKEPNYDEIKEFLK